MKLPTFTFPRGLRRAALGLLLATAGAAQAQTMTYTYTAPGGAQTYQVPPGVTRLQVVATGASGGEGYRGAASGKGAQVQATLVVVPGEVLMVVVGGRGSTSSATTQSAGGYNGGGKGGNYVGSGGGATDLRRAYDAASASTRTDDYLQSRNALVVAAGGGGGGGSNPGGSGDGGSGGAPTGSTGSSVGGNNGGVGATQMSVGSGNSNGSSGSTNTGGDGAAMGSNFVGGGGGGGGYYGGGGGNIGGGGGGGSSWATAGSSPTYSLASAAGDGSLTITPLAAPTLSNLSPTSGSVGTSVTLTGTNLSSATAVSFNNTPTTFTANANGTLTAPVPSGASSGNVTVTTPGGVSNGVAFTVTVPTTAAPVITVPATNTITNQPSVDVIGTAPANSTIMLYYSPGGSTQPGTFTATATGTFRYLLSLSDGTYTVYVTAQSPGASVSPNSNAVTFTVDTTPPTVTSLSSSAGSSTSTAPIPFAVSFSEAVTGFAASGISVSNGTVSSGPSGSGTQYTFSVAPTGNGPVTVSIRANAVQDAATNSNPASNAVSVQYTAPVASGLSVQYQTGDLGQPTDNQLRPFLQLVNSGTTAVPYSSLTVRYWLTVENFMGQLVTPIDYAKLGTSFVSARYVALATPRQGAYGYLEYSFAAGAGNLAAGTNSGPIYGKAYKPDYSNFDETDDWSYQTSSSFTANDHVTLYQNGTLIAGTEPPAVTATTALNVFSASRDAATSTQAVSVQLQVRNTGNVPVNYADLKVRYYFTRDGASTLVANIDYAKLGASNIGVRTVNLAAPVSGADAYVEFTFSAALGVFYPRTSTDDILAKIRKDTYQALDQTNDYSFTGSTALQVNNRFPAYLSNTLVFGTPPAGAPARMAATGPAASAGGATIVAAAGGPLALTASPNPFGEQFTLRFALPTTQAYTLAVYDGQGRLVQQVASGQAEAEQAQELAVPTQAYAAGLYLVRLTTADGVQTLKLVKP